MAKVLTATGMALLSIGLIATVQPQSASKAGQVALAEATPIDAPDATRRGGPKGGGRDEVDVGITAAPAVDVAPAEGRRKEGPKGDSGSGRTEATPALDSAPVEGRRKMKPKRKAEHGRTATTPLIIGALDSAAILALVVSET